VTNARLERFTDLTAASQRAAALTAQALAQAITLRGRASLALSGGSTPGRFFELLAGQSLPWDAVHVFWADERLAPLDSPQSNYRLAREHLLSRAPIPLGNIHPAAGAGDPSRRAKAYEALLREAFAGENPPRFDVIHLGLGSDGHTASLFPGQPALSEKERWVVAVEYAKASPPVPRLTLTLPVINAAKLVFFLISGADKIQLAQKILAGEGDAYPASLVQPARPPVWLAADAGV